MRTATVPLSPRGGTCTFSVYTQQEIEAGWHDTDGQGNHQAREKGTSCVCVECGHDDALELSALFVRQVFAIPSCCHYDGVTLSLYCGDAGQHWVSCRNSAQSLVDMFAYFRWGKHFEGVPLFDSYSETKPINTQDLKADRDSLLEACKHILENCTEFNDNDFDVLRVAVNLSEGSK